MFDQELQIFTNYGIRPTERRLQILHILNAENIYMSAGEVRQKMREKYGVDISFDTLYKNLQYFVECQILYEFTRQNEREYFVNQGNNHFAICTECKKIEPLKFECPFNKFGDQYGQINSHRVELFVMCHECLGVLNA